MRVVVLIPARFKSSRFPGKPLVPLLGKPMVAWVAELCEAAVGRHNVYVATDDERIAEKVRSFGFQTVMTSTSALTGTDRLAEAVNSVEADIYINVQGDEPLVRPNDIKAVIDVKKNNMTEVVNACCRLTSTEDVASRNIPKVVFNEEKKLIYMSRSVVPGRKDINSPAPGYFKQVCIYAFTKKELVAYAGFGRKSYLEAIEDIEVLRFLELGIDVRMVEVQSGSLAVDVPEDVPMVEKALAMRMQDDEQERSV